MKFNNSRTAFIYGNNGTNGFTYTSLYRSHFPNSLSPLDQCHKICRSAKKCKAEYTMLMPV